MPRNPKLDKRLAPLIARVWQASYEPVADLKATAWVTKEPVPYSQRRSGRKKVLATGDVWGELWDCAWFHFTGKVPATARGRSVALLINVSGEGLIVDRAGNPVQGLTLHSRRPDAPLGRWNKREYPFKDRARGGEKVDLWVDVGCNSLFGKPLGGTLREACVAVYRPQLHALSFDLAVLHDLMQQLPATDARRHAIRTALHDAADVMHEITEQEARRARRILKPELAKKGGDPSFSLSAVGHAHLDLAWLWPERETYRKGARTFATALSLMDRYHDYVFGASQPQLYEWIKDKYPALYRRVRKRIAEGRWECQGCMWVEADTNVTGAESLVRQVLYGKQFYRQEFGIDVNHLWLPDVFGYTASLPQILVKSGCRYFLTQKLSWSRVNVYPHHTFWWEGIDGSKVLTHFPPEDTYNSNATPKAVRKAETNYKDKDVSDRGIMLFGIGDGGGGPGVEHLESLRRVKNLAGLAPVRQERAADFFPHLEKNAHRYATWTGELYLEYHQGTFTSQARNKRYNRKMEFALRELELWAALAGRLRRHRYPASALARIWRRILFLQFHDVLPGSSITRVYNESVAEYARLLEETNTLVAKADAALCGAIDTSAQKQPVVVFNSLGWPRTEWLKVGRRWQQVCVPSLGYATIDAAQRGPRAGGVTADGNRLENGLLRLTLHRDGSIAALYDKEAGRNVLAPGARANVLKVWRDDGNAWDFTMDYADRPAERPALASSRSFTDGPRAVCEQTYRYGASRISQQLVLTAGSRRIDFVTRVDWKENGKMLRVDFPVNVHARQATCDIQFGNVKRPTHRSTSWDMAKQEICAHKWVDISEPAYGVALLNDCKYGHQVKGNVMNLNLLRSPHTPDPKADRAKHVFTYALFPHPGDCFAAGVVRAGYELNTPLRAVPTRPRRGKRPPLNSLLEVDKPNIVVETVKQGEDGTGTIVRMYEAFGSATRARLRLGFDAGSARLVNLMEEPLKKLPVRRGKIPLAFKPYEILTVRLD